MPEKLKEEQVVNLFHSKGYEPLEGYVNCRTPILCLKDGYRYKISYHNLHYGKSPSLWGFNNIENLEYNINVVLKKKQSKSIFLGYEIIKKKNKKRILLHFKCDCGEKFSKTLENAVYKTYICCNACQIIKRGKSKRVGKKAIEYIESKGYKVFNKSIIYKNNDLIEVKDELGFKGFVTYNHIKRGGKMSLFDVRVNKKHYVYNVNKWIEREGIAATCVRLIEQRHTRQSLEFVCSCGHKFITSISSFQNGKIRCDQCAKSISRYEHAFKSFLDEIDIKYIYRYSINQCRDILPLPFDFYIIDDNFLVEIDGEGHYQVCNFNGMNTKKAKISYQSTQMHDKIKTKYCIDNNIPLLRLPYYLFTNDLYKEKFMAFRQKVANSG